MRQASFGCIGICLLLLDFYQLCGTHCRVKHLTTLLAESEQDTARLTQQNAALKEELRRQERSAEREQHLHNLEYLKNVVFKVSVSQQNVHTMC